MRSPLPTPEFRGLQAVTVRELFTVARTRSPLALFVGVFAVVLGIAVFGGEPRYLPTVADLLLPLELLVPTVAITLGYRSIAADEQRGERAVLETYPVSSRTYVLGVFLGRAVALVAILGVPLLAAWAYLATTTPETPTLFAIRRGGDSPIAFARFLLLTLVFGLAVLALSLALSALAGSRRSALVLAGAGLVAVVVLFDLLVLRGFTAGVIPDGALLAVLALSPTSAYRGLVLETVLQSPGTAVAQAIPLLNVLGLLLVLLGSLVVATVALKRR
jgi:ABC-2 type transport system permease protein